MKYYLPILWIALCLNSTLQAQNNNGQIDQLQELGTEYKVKTRMPGGAELVANMYLPVTSDSMTFGTTLFGQNLTLELIPKGTQLIVYPTMINALGDTVPNPNPYQLPFLLSRTPYGKDGVSEAGGLISMMGYAFMYQDTRGRGESGGVFMPLYSDSWDKTPYETLNMPLDITAPSDSANARKHEDGWLTYQYILNDLRRPYDVDNDGTIDTIAPICNGTVGLAGASAFAMPHFQLTATHKIDRSQPGVRGMLSAIATAEHYNTTMYHNGVMREHLAANWLRGQIFDLVDSNSVDNDLQNALHTPSDYGLTTDQEVLDLTLDYLCEFKYAGQPVSHAYPNSVGRKEVDISHAPVDANGEGDANGQFSRYSNMDVPTYHLSGWYDIFVNGQLETWRNMRQHGNPNQKIVIGPWAHFTLGSNVSGDQVYPDNVGDVLGFTFDIDNAGLGSLANLDLSKVLSTEPVAFLRQTLNSNGYVKLGEPIIRIPESQKWQGGSVKVRIPSQNYDVSLYDFFNYLGGTQNLPQIPIEVDLPILPNVNMSIPIPNFGAILPFPLIQPITPPNAVDVLGTAPDVRFYVIGPTETGATGGNYWFHSNEFPLTGSQIQYTEFYMHQNGSLDMDIPTFDEGTVSYPHDPDNPVTSIGGNNLSLKTPNGRESRGQMDYTDSVWVNLTMNHSGVVQFSTVALPDTMSMIGFPKATLYVKSEPQGVASGETDTDFFIRILDVYPDGREFLVVEGAVNARAREYARSIYNNAEDDNASFSNINIGQIYELQFQTLPIAYTFGTNHKIKVLVSSSNYPRYQSNPNIPLEAGDFFRRQPNDGQSYTYQGQTYSPRIANNSIAFSDIHPSRIELPLFNHNFATNVETIQKENSPVALKIQPNPTSNRLLVEAARSSDYTLRVFNVVGQQVLEQELSGQQFELSLGTLEQGIYHLELIDHYTQQKQLARVMKL